MLRHPFVAGVAGQSRLLPLHGVRGTTAPALLLPPPAVPGALGPVVGPRVDDRRRRPSLCLKRCASAKVWRTEAEE